MNVNIDLHGTTDAVLEAWINIGLMCYSKDDQGALLELIQEKQSRIFNQNGEIDE